MTPTYERKPMTTNNTLTHSATRIIVYGTDETRTRYCPECQSDWRGSPIPEENKHHYGTNSGYFSRLIGVEIYGGYDGTDHWRCPDCASTFRRR